MSGCLATAVAIFGVGQKVLPMPSALISWFDFMVSCTDTTISEFAFPVSCYAFQLFACPAESSLDA